MWARRRETCGVRSDQDACAVDPGGRWNRRGARLKHAAHGCDAGGGPARNVRVEASHALEELGHVIDGGDAPVGDGAVSHDGRGLVVIEGLGGRLQGGLGRKGGRPGRRGRRWKWRVRRRWWRRACCNLVGNASKLEVAARAHTLDREGNLRTTSGGGERWCPSARRPRCTLRCARPTRQAAVRAARASLTSNFEKSLKKNETALDFCMSSRFVGSFELSPKLPPADEQNFPVQRRRGASTAHNRRIVRRGGLRGAARA